MITKIVAIESCVMQHILFLVKSGLFLFTYIKLIVLWNAMFNYGNAIYNTF